MSLIILFGKGLGVVGLLLWFYILLYKRKKEIFEDLRGKDNRWQLIELATLMWLIFCPIFLVISVLGVEINPFVWGVLDSIFLISIGGKAYMETRKPKNDG